MGGRTGFLASFGGFTSTATAPRTTYRRFICENASDCQIILLRFSARIPEAPHRLAAQCEQMSRQAVRVCGGPVAPHRKQLGLMAQQVVTQPTDQPESRSLLCSKVRS